LGTIDLHFGDDAITGEMGQMGQILPVDMTLEAPTFGDGQALEMVIAGLPLARGYRTTLRQFDVMAQKVRPFQLEVTTSESASVTAGPFETYVLQLAPLDGDESGRGTMHVMQTAPHYTVKAEFKMPATMGGGAMTMELVEVGE